MAATHPSGAARKKGAHQAAPGKTRPRKTGPRKKTHSARGMTSAVPQTPNDPPPTLRRFLGGFRWDRVETEPYKISAHKGGEFCGASRQVLIGKNGSPVNSHVRYYELQPGVTRRRTHRPCARKFCRARSRRGPIGSRQETCATLAVGRSASAERRW